MRRIFLAATLCLALGALALDAPGFAQTGADASATKQDVERYFQAVHSHDTMLKMMQAMAEPMHQTTHEQCERDKDRLPADCEERINKMLDGMMKEMPLDEMMQTMVPAYQKHFTKGDMDALIAFYSGPTGQKVLRELPAVMAEGMESMMPIMKKSVETMTERAEREVTRMMDESPKKARDVPPPAKN
jgi:hypothetical protein